MKNFNIRYTISFLMGVIFYIILIVIIIGFAIKFIYNQETVNILKGSTIIDTLKGVISLDSNSFFALAAYLSALSPILFALIIFVGYLLQQKYKGAILGFFLIISLSIALLVKI